MKTSSPYVVLSAAEGPEPALSIPEGRSDALSFLSHSHFCVILSEAKDLERASARPLSTALSQANLPR
jgi:hypothetical protein